MIIYTTMPLEIVFDGFDRQISLEEVEINGVKMLVEPVSRVEAKIVRLLSPNPQDYLNPRYAPGQKIYFRPDVS